MHAAIVTGTADPAQIITAIMGVGGGGMLLAQLVRWIMKRADGSATRQRVRNTDIVTERADAIRDRREADKRADASDKTKNLALDEAARYRRMLIENGIDPGEPSEIYRTGRNTKSVRGSTAAE